MPEYLNPRNGLLHLATALPGHTVAPDLGPKCYIASGRVEEVPLRRYSCDTDPAAKRRKVTGTGFGQPPKSPSAAAGVGAPVRPAPGPSGAGPFGGGVVGASARSAASAAGPQATAGVASEKAFLGRSGSGPTPFRPPSVAVAALAPPGFSSEIGDLNPQSFTGGGPAGDSADGLAGSKRRRGRPPKSHTDLKLVNGNLAGAPAAKPQRGRPPKSRSLGDLAGVGPAAAEQGPGQPSDVRDGSPAVKRRMGRPPKKADAVVRIVTDSAGGPTAVKRPQGRPPGCPPGLPLGSPSGRPTPVLTLAGDPAGGPDPVKRGPGRPPTKPRSDRANRGPNRNLKRGPEEQRRGQGRPPSARTAPAAAAEDATAARFRVVEGNSVTKLHCDLCDAFNVMEYCAGVEAEGEGEGKESLGGKRRQQWQRKSPVVARCGYQRLDDTWM